MELKGVRRSLDNTKEPGVILQELRSYTSEVKKLRSYEELR